MNHEKKEKINKYAKIDITASKNFMLAMVKISMVKILNQVSRLAILRSMKNIDR